MVCIRVKGLGNERGFRAMVLTNPPARTDSAARSSQGDFVEIEMTGIVPTATSLIQTCKIIIQRTQMG